MIIGTLPVILLFGAAFLLSLYSMIRCRIVARNYLPIIGPVIATKPVIRAPEIRQNLVAQYCSNCGKELKGHEKFCMECGQQVSF